MSCCSVHGGWAGGMRRALKAAAAAAAEAETEAERPPTAAAAVDQPLKRGVECKQASKQQGKQVNKPTGAAKRGLAVAAS